MRKKKSARILPFNLPRAPLPKQTGGAHRVKKDILPRKAKHKKKDLDLE